MNPCRSSRRKTRDETEDLSDPVGMAGRLGLIINRLALAWAISAQCGEVVVRMVPPKVFLLPCLLSMVPPSPHRLFKTSLTAGRTLRYNPYAGQRTLNNQHLEDDYLALSVRLLNLARHGHF